MSLNHAYLIKGFVLAHNPPKEVTDALAAVIASLDAVPSREVIVTGNVSLEIPLEIRDDSSSPDGLPEGDTEVAPPPEPEKTAKTVKRHKWSDEARAAQAERMRARQAAGLMGRKNKSPAAPDGSPSGHQVSADRENPEPEAIEHPDFKEEDLRITVQAKRRTSQLTDSDWPEIKEMLAAGRDRKAIASDYDEEVEDLDFFISSNQRREAKQPPGEALASPSDEASDATRRMTW